MNRKKGHQRSKHLRQRDKSKRGGNAATDLPQGEAGTLARLAESYLENLAVRNYTPDTIEGRRDALKVFLLWATERELLHPPPRSPNPSSKATSATSGGGAKPTANPSASAPSAAA